MTAMEEQLYGFYQFPGSRNHWEEKKILNIFVSRMSLKRDIFVNFLPQKFMTKYGIVSTYSVTFESQKILACLQCMQGISYNFRTVVRDQGQTGVEWRSDRSQTGVGEKL